MEADFSGYATKAGVKCSDGRTIDSAAFKQQDQVKVPLVWQHGHNDPENVLGHALLEARPDGMYTYGFFNKSQKARHAHDLVEHGDITMLSIWANQLVERAGMVLHGAIREVSLVLSGANPGALIENVTIRHADGEDTFLDEEAIITTGLTIEHELLKHADGDDEEEDGETLQDIYEAMSDKEKDVVHYMVGQALEANVGNAEEDEEGGEAQQDNVGEADGDTISHDNSDKEGSDMTGRNVFEQDGKDKDTGPVLSHEDVKGIIADATKIGSLRQAVEQYAIAHGITNIDMLFPEARALTGTPEWEKRQTEWVAGVLGGTRKSPFSRVKTWTADITYDEARARGYVTGDLKEEEWFSISKRETGPQTIYKKQKLDRDDIIDITDFDVVTWMKGEMRLMLDEEIARAILVGDGRQISDPAKIKEDKIRPIVSDDQYYTLQVGVNLSDASSSVEEVLDAVLLNREFFKGTGTPDFYTTEKFIAQCLLLRDTLGRKLYRDVSELATTMRVGRLIPVEILNAYPNTIGILVNLTDYVVGTDKGGQVTMFDDFDIDYNQEKYLIETRLSGALVTPKSAMHVYKTASGSTAVVVAAPTQDKTTWDVTLPVDPGYTWAKANGTAVTGTVELAPGENVSVHAVPVAGKHLAPGQTSWSFLRPPS